MEVGQLNKKIGCIIQARMGSSRLPGKVLLPLPLEGNTSLLGRIVNSLQNSRFTPTIILATSTDQSNDKLENFCREFGIGCFRGSENDVLSRFQRIQNEHNFDVIIRLTGDNPILDINLLDKSIQSHVHSISDYTWTEELPVGMNFEIFNGEVLLKLPEHELSPEDKEHVTLYIKKSGKFKIHKLKLGLKKNYTNCRLTVDYPSDFLLVSIIMSLLKKSQKAVLPAINDIREKYPWLMEINQGNYQRRNYQNSFDELENAKLLLKNCGFDRVVEILDQE